jgi:transcriptional regulator with XRE-family HTH domain
VIDRYHEDDVREIPNVADLGDTIARRRDALGITQAQLAFSIGVNRRVIGELERGKETVQVGIALRALAAVGVRLHAEPWR